MELFRPDNAGKLGLVWRRNRDESMSQVPEPDPGFEWFACRKHEWKPRRRGPQPKPPESMCPGCLAEASERDAAGPSVPVGGGVPATTYPEGDPVGIRLESVRRRLDAAWDDHAAKSGVVRPGSHEERQALDRISELRDVERERLIAKSGGRGILVSSRIEGCQHVEYRAVSAGRNRRRVVRMAS